MPPNARARALPLLCALALGLAAIGGALADPTEWLAGEGTVDAYGTWWYEWWVAHALSGGQSPMYSDVLFFPWGKDILRHTGGNVLDVALLAPVRWIFGPVIAWNALVFAAVATNGLAAAHWARRLGAGLPGVLLAEVIIGLHPFVLNELGHGRPTQAVLAPVLLALAEGDDALRGAGRGAVIRAAVWLAIAGWIYWYAASFAALALCVLALGRPLWTRAKGLLGVGLGSMALTAPLAAPVALALSRGEVPGLIPVDRWLAGVQDFTNAQGGSVQISTLSAGGIAGLLSERGWTAEGLALGVVTALPLLFAPRRWLAVAGLGLCIALGPFPFGVRNPLYLGLVAALPPYERLYWPVRAVALLAVVGVVGVVHALQRLPERARAGAAGLLAVALIGEVVVRGSWPIGRWRPDVPEVVRCLAQVEGAGVVLPYGKDQLPLVWQTVHERPMLNGMAERSRALVPEEQKALREDNGWVRAVVTLPIDPRAAIAWTEEEKQAVYDLGYRWVLLRPEALLEVGNRVSPRERLRAAQRALRPLLGVPVREDEDVVLYAPWGGLDACVESPAR